MKRVLVPLAPGFEELEAVTIVDLLRRAGIEVTTAALSDNPVTGNHGIGVVADTTLEAAGGGDWDLVALPGGLPGANHLRDDARLGALLRRLAAAGRDVAAICAAPMVLAHAGLLEGRRATSFPGFLDAAAIRGLTVLAEPVVVDGPVITSRGPGTAMDFALALIERLEGPAARAAVEARLQRPERP